MDKPMGWEEQNQMMGKKYMKGFSKMTLGTDMGGKYLVVGTTTSVNLNMIIK